MPAKPPREAGIATREATPRPPRSEIAGRCGTPPGHIARSRACWRAIGTSVAEGASPDSRAGPGPPGRLYKETPSKGPWKLATPAGFAGQPADTVLAVCASLATGAADTGALILVAPDADLGGVRIAARVLTVVPRHARVQLIDVGDIPHTAQKLFPEATLDVLHGITASGPHADMLTRFAAAVAGRGYPVEQEALIRAALRSALRM